MAPSFLDGRTPTRAACTCEGFDAVDSTERPEDFGGTASSLIRDTELGESASEASSSVVSTSASL